MTWHEFVTNVEARLAEIGVSRFVRIKYIDNPGDDPHVALEKDPATKEPVVAIW